MAVLNLTKGNFQKEALESDKPVLIDFWASWCGPCQMMAPVVDAVAEKREDVKVCKINVDDEPVLAQQFGISSIPTLVLMKNGKPVRQMLGYRIEDEVLKFLD